MPYLVVSSFLFFSTKLLLLFVSLSSSAAHPPLLAGCPAAAAKDNSVSERPIDLVRMDHGKRRGGAFTMAEIQCAIRGNNFRYNASLICYAWFIKSYTYFAWF
jgi:hypothetical protein